MNLRICVWFPNMVLGILESLWGFYCSCIYRHSPTWDYTLKAWILVRCLTVDHLFWSTKHGLGWFNTEMLWWGFHCCKRVYYLWNNCSQCRGNSAAQKWVHCPPCTCLPIWKIPHGHSSVCCRVYKNTAWYSSVFTVAEVFLIALKDVSGVCFEYTYR